MKATKIIFASTGSNWSTSQDVVAVMEDQDLVEWNMAEFPNSPGRALHTVEQSYKFVKVYLKQQHAHTLFTCK